MEKGIVITKESSLSELVSTIKEWDSSLMEESDDEKVLQAEREARQAGACEYEIIRSYFLGTPDDERQGLLSLYYSKWSSVNTSSIEELAEYFSALVKIKNDFELQDPLIR